MGGRFLNSVPERPAAADGDGSCVICMSAPKDTAVLPCRHMCLCPSCAREVDKCPICRGPVDSTLCLKVWSFSLTTV